MEVFNLLQPSKAERRNALGSRDAAANARSFSEYLRRQGPVHDLDRRAQREGDGEGNLRREDLRRRLSRHGGDRLLPKSPAISQPAAWIAVCGSDGALPVRFLPLAP